MVNVFHAILPLDASNATRLPRNVQQQSKTGLAPVTSSNDETRYNKVVPTSVGEPVIIAAGCSSTLVVQSALPVSASIA